MIHYTTCKWFTKGTRRSSERHHQNGAGAHARKTEALSRARIDRVWARAEEQAPIAMSRPMADVMIRDEESSNLVGLNWLEELERSYLVVKSASAPST